MKNRIGFREDLNDNDIDDLIKKIDAKIAELDAVSSKK